MQIQNTARVRIGERNRIYVRFCESPECVQYDEKCMFRCRVKRLIFTVDRKVDYGSCKSTLKALRDE
jgi:hypothetical protein